METETEYITAEKLKLAALEVRRVARASPLYDDDDPTIESPAPAIPAGVSSPLGDADALAPTEQASSWKRPRQLIGWLLLSCAAVLAAFAARILSCSRWSTSALRSDRGAPPRVTT